MLIQRRTPVLFFASLIAMLLFPAFRAHALSDAVRDRGQRMVDEINIYRRLSGLHSVTLDVDISEGCVLHAQYLDQNPDVIKEKSLAVHMEDPARPGYTQAGADAGASSDISFFTGGNDNDPGVRALETFYNSYYHRTPLLSFGLRKVGYGDVVGGASGYQISLVRFGTSDFDQEDAGYLLTPPPGSAGIRNNAVGFEIPAPLPNFGPANGNPIVAYFFLSPTVEWVGSTVSARPIKSKPNSKAKPKILSHTVIAPNKPVNPVFEANSICLITTKVLPKNSRIDVEIDYNQGGAAKVLKWSFSTSAKGPFDLAAATAGAPPQIESDPVITPSFANVNEAVQFSVAASDATPITYTWNFGDGTTDSSGPNVMHTYPVAGDYAVNLTITNGAGKSVFRTLLVNVSVPFDIALKAKD